MNKLNTIDNINEFLRIHSLVLTINNEKWHVLIEDTFKSFRESLHYDIDYRIDGNSQFTNIIIIGKFSEIRITDKTAFDELKEFARCFEHKPLLAYLREKV